MTDAIHRITYRSQAAPAAQRGDALSAILDVSQVCNVRDHITGALTYCDGWFIQVIEGPLARLDDLMLRLARDDRHFNIDVAERIPVPKRLFPDWCMASVHLEPSLEPVVSDILRHWEAAAGGVPEALLHGLELKT